MDIREADLFVTGGAGSLGQAIARRRKEEGWKGRSTVFSTDTHKHERMRRDFPDLTYVQGDIRDSVTLYNAMVGHDVVLHCAAVKVIPASEFHSIDTYRVNVRGSLNVCQMAVRAGVRHVLGISTDKACHAANAYGATKYLMEKSFQEYARAGMKTQFHLVRYGNVLESKGSVIEAWKNSIARGEPIRMTNPNMTRFWLSPSQAVDMVLEALNVSSGCIYIPKMPALSIGKLADYTVGREHKIEYIPLRPGEKIDETLLTCEEGSYALDHNSCFLLSPTTSKRMKVSAIAYTSDTAHELTREELMEMLNG